MVALAEMLESLQVNGQRASDTAFSNPAEGAVLKLAIAQLHATADALALLLDHTSAPAGANESEHIAGAASSPAGEAEALAASAAMEPHEPAGLAEHLLRLKARQA